jgi:hypothetical protein
MNQFDFNFLWLSSKFQMYMLSYFLYIYYHRRVTNNVLNKVRYTVKPSLKGTSIVILISEGNIVNHSINLFSMYNTASSWEDGVV